jgi:drug/metabolite transporter (DMT)-like permease
MLAFKHDKVTRVYPVYFFEPVFGLIFDIVLYNQSFEWLQVVGILIVFSMAGLKLVQAYYSGD